METIKSYPVRSSDKSSARKTTLTLVLVACVGVALYCIAAGAELVAVASLVVAGACDFFVRKS